MGFGGFKVEGNSLGFREIGFWVSSSGFRATGFRVWAAGV